MLTDIIAVKPLEGYQLYICFEDGIEGIVDISQIIQFTGIFAPLQDRAYFSQVQINPEIGTVSWSNEADLDLDVLYSIVTGQPIPNYAKNNLTTTAD